MMIIPKEVHHPSKTLDSSKEDLENDFTLLVKVSKYYYHFFSSEFFVSKNAWKFNATICLKSHHSGSSNS